MDFQGQTPANQDTDSVISTQNPQMNAPSQPANKGSDFQAPVNPDQIKQNTLTVRSTGEPITAGGTTQIDQVSVWPYVLAFAAIAVVAALLLWLLNRRRTRRKATGSTGSDVLDRVAFKPAKTTGVTMSPAFKKSAKSTSGSKSTVTAVHSSKPAASAFQPAGKSRKKAKAKKKKRR